MRAPLAGVVTRRTANAGLNIDPATPLFTIVDLSTVWVIARSVRARLREGARGKPGDDHQRRVSRPDASRPRQLYRSAGAAGNAHRQASRVEVPNPSGRLRLGMYVDAPCRRRPLREGMFVPKSAVQIVGSDAVVYVASDGQSGRFVERKVEIGGENGDRLLVLSWSAAGQRLPS